MPYGTGTQIEKLNRLYKKQDELYHGFAVRFGISDTAMWVLYAMCTEKEPCSQYDLSNAWCVPKQTVNSAIAGLEKAGYIRLEAVSGTRNRKNLVLTEAGRAFCSETVIPLIKAENRTLMRFSVDERRLFLTLFEKQIEYLREETDGIGKK